jgi:hypothetical protein
MEKDKLDYKRQILSEKLKECVFITKFVTFKLSEEALKKLPYGAKSKLKWHSL